MSGAILTVGSRLGDHTLVRSLGAGGMGAVYLARSDQGAEHALKVIAFQRGEHGQRTLQRFQREGEALAKVDRHPGIVSIHGCGVDPARGCGYLVLEYVDGSDVARLLDETRPLPLERALDLGQQIAAALAHVHAAGIVHRDLKPANVLLRRDGRAVLTDFGVARDDQAERMTRSGAMVGTAHYMSPEQAGARWEAVGPHSDVFSLGSLLHELLTGATPFEADRPIELLAQIATAQPEPPSRLRRGVSSDLDQLVLRALAKEPSERPTAAELAAGLGRIRAGESLAWSRPSRVRVAFGRLRRGDPRALATTLALVTLPLLIGLGWFRWLGPRQEAQAFVAEHTTWSAEVLEPWALGAGLRPPALREVERRLEALDAARAALGPDPALEDAWDHLRAAQRVLALELAEVPAGRERTAPQLTAAARVELDSGDRRAARRHVERALRLDREFLPAQLLAHELDAVDEPLAFLRRLPELREVAPQLLQRPAPQIATELYVDALARGRAGAGVVVEVGGLIEALGLTLPELAETKRATLTRSFDAWADDLRQAVRAREELAWASDLGAAVRAHPLVRLSPELHEHLVDLQRELFWNDFTDLPLPDRIRPVLIEQALYYEVDSTRPSNVGLRGALMDQAVIRKIERPLEQNAQLALACLRAEPPLLLTTVAKLTDQAGWAWLIERYPRSRAARLGQIMRRCEDQTLGSDLLPAAEAIRHFEAALDPDADVLEDLADSHLGYGLHYLNRARGHLVADETLPQARREAQLRALQRDCPRVRQLLERQVRIHTSSLRLEARALSSLRGAEAALTFLQQHYPAALQVGQEALWARSEPAREQFQQMDMTGSPLSEVAEILADEVAYLLELDRAPEALELAREALALLDRDISNRLSSSARHLIYRGLIAAVLLALDRPTEALAELEPFHDEGFAETGFVLDYVPTLIANGREADARAYLREALRREPGDERLQTLSRTLR